MNNSSEIEDLEVVLERIFQDDNTIVYDDKDNEIDKKNLKSEISNSISYDQQKKYKIAASEEKISENIKFFELFFKQFIDKYGMIGVSSLIIDRNEKITIEEFVGKHIMNAVLYLNSKRVSRILAEWKRTNRVDFSVGFVLEGAHVNKKLNSNEINVEPIIINKNITVLTKKELLIPFFNNNINIIVNDYSNYISIFEKCMTLVCDSYIRIQKWWIHDELVFFNPSLSPISLDIPDIQESIELTREQIRLTQELHSNFENMLKNTGFKISYSRWLNSKRVYNDIDKAIELRIALDALFTNPKQGDNYPSMVMRILAAKFVEDDRKKRSPLCEDLREFYADASIVIHGRELPLDSNKKPGSPRKIRIAQKVCRDSLLRITKENGIPNWNEFLLE